MISYENIDFFVVDNGSWSCSHFSWRHKMHRFHWFVVSCIWLMFGFDGTCANLHKGVGLKFWCISNVFGLFFFVIYIAILIHTRCCLATFSLAKCCRIVILSHGALRFVLEARWMWTKQMADKRFDKSFAFKRQFLLICQSHNWSVT